MSIARPTPVISEDIASLLSAYISPIKNGKRKISTSILTPPRRPHPQPPSPSAPSSTPSTGPQQTISPNTFAAYYVSEEESEIEIPAIVDSIETLEFIGLDSKTALKVWDWYANNPYPESGQDLVGTAQCHVRYAYQVEDCTSASQDWNAGLIALGINDTLRTAILLPEFSDVRYTASMKYWVEDSLQCTFEALEGLDEQLRNEAPKILAAARESKRASSAMSPTSQSPPSRKESLKKKSKAAEASGSAAPVPQVNVAITAAAPAHKDHYTMLFHACSLTRAHKLYNVSTGRIDLCARATTNGDFSGMTSMCYWTPQKATADRHASYLKPRMGIGDVAIVQIAVHEAYTIPLDKLVLYDDASEVTWKWRQLVFESRNGRYPRDDMSQELSEADLIIGHILSGEKKKYKEMDDWTEIDDSDAMILDMDGDGEKRKAIQWGFTMTNYGEGRFERACAGMGWIHNVGGFKTTFDLNP